MPTEEEDTSERRKDMRQSIPFIVLLLTSCGQERSDPSRVDSRFASPPQEVIRVPASPDMVSDAPSPQNADFAPTAVRSPGPAVSPTAAPGVAFNYRYAFRLPPDRIAAVQEHHAQACERLGAARCRITGMLFRVVDARNIEAMLQLKLEPGLARQFGREGIAAVVRAEGALTESEISGLDAAGGIDAANRSLADLTADLARTEAELVRGNRQAPERTRLEYEVRQLRDRIRILRDNRDAQQDSLATTPMLFRYGAGTLVPRAEPDSSLYATAERAFANFGGAMLVMLAILLTLLPWALLAGLIWWLVRRFLPSLPKAPEPVA